MKEWMTARELLPHINAAREKKGYKPYKNSTSILLALRRNHVPCRFQRGHNEFATQKSISIISKNPSDTASKISEKKQAYIKQKLLQAGKKHRHEQCGVRELLPIVNEIRAKKGMVLIVSTSALSNLLTCAKVPRKKIERTLYIYSAREAIKAATKLTKQNDNWCLYATEQELDSGEWAPCLKPAKSSASVTEDSKTSTNAAPSSAKDTPSPSESSSTKNNLKTSPHGATDDSSSATKAKNTSTESKKTQQKKQSR